MATTYWRGHKCYFDGEVWRYIDNDKKFDEQRPCKKCGKSPTEEGYDACVGHVHEALSVCCGHGVRNSYIVKKV